MAKEVKMPQLSDTMDSGKILSWNKQEGDQIQRGDILAEVETDKANLEIEAFDAGTLLKIVTSADESAQVGDVIAYIGEQGEEIEESVSSNGDGSASESASEEEQRESSPEESEDSEESEDDENEQPKREAQPKADQQPVQRSSASSNGSGEGRVKVSPLAKKMAEQRNLDISSITGTGPDGRIVKRDVERASEEKPAAEETPTRETKAPARAPQPRPAPGSGANRPMSKMRATIARRMQESVQQAPHFYVTTSIYMDEVIRLRKILKEKPGYEGTSINHFIVKAAAYGIQNEPRVNFAVREEEQVYEPESINIGIITALEDGLLIPVVHDADQLSLQDIVIEARAAVDRARAGRLSASDLSGGTFSISNMGMFDIESFTAIINPGQGSVLAVSSTKPTVVAEDGEMVIRQVMKVTISVDHRIIDGVMAGNFLKYFKEGLENPALLMA